MAIFMLPQKIDDDLYVSPQIKPEDLQWLASLGFRSIISNRPDAETEDQPTFSEISREAHRHGMQVRYIPVASGMLADEDITAFKSALLVLPKPILAYCRTGTRCTFLWALSEAPNLSLYEINARANAAGYELEKIEARLQAIQFNCVFPKI